ncbi:MAG: aminoglycoside phosphotransferase family protein [Actinomycetota bacterium]
MSEELEEPLPGALGAVRVGSTVRKGAGPWTPTVHALLRFLRETGFELAPEPLGMDDRDREILSFMGGVAAGIPWPPSLLTDTGVIALASALRRYHEVVRGFDLGEDARWRIGRRSLKRGEIVCHGDFAPWNTLWDGDLLVGIVDWDMAEPGTPLHDVAFLALHVIPLRSDDRAARVGFASEPPRAHRLSLLCDVYGGVTPREVVEAATTFHELDRERTIAWGAEGREPWATFLRSGELTTIADDEEWLAEHAAALLRTT